MVIGLFRTPSDAALCLDNLAEADFGPATISLVMRTPQDVTALVNASGPLNGLPIDDLPSRLVKLGLKPAEAGPYREGVLNGGVFIAVSADDADAAAAEMLGDGRATLIRTV